MSLEGGEPTLYEVLEVGPNATLDEIQSAYDRIIGYLGVDAMATYTMASETDISDQRAKVEQAFETLGDPELRARYDDQRGGAALDYPEVVVPEAAGGSSMTLGHVDAQTASEPTPTPPPRAGDEAQQTEAPPRTSPHVSTAPPPPAKEISSPPPPVRRPKAGPAILAAESRDRPRPVSQRLQPTDIPEITVDTEVSGAMFKRLRESADATLADIAAITKISKNYLRAVEENDFDSLPARVYVRGFVYEYARALGLDAQLWAAGYMNAYLRYVGGQEI